MANIELDGPNKKIKVDSGDLTLDVPGDIVLDADGGDVVFADGGTNLLKVTNSSSDVVLQPQVDTKDIIFKQYDGTTVATIEDNGTLNVPTGKLAINATAITSTAAELNILDGVTATAAEINLIDGGTARGTTAIADGDGVLINDAGTMRMTSVETLATYIGGGLTEADTWRQSTASNVSTGSAYITANWERDDSYGNGLLGTGLTESSGIFSFPSTGFWYVHFSLYGQNDNGSNALRHYKGELFVTTDNSTYNKVAVGVDSNSGTTTVNTYLGATPAFKIIDVTNTTNVKFQCGYNVHANVAYSGSTNENQTFVMAMKLGDT